MSHYVSQSVSKVTVAKYETYLLTEQVGILSPQGGKELLAVRGECQSPRAANVVFVPEGQADRSLARSAWKASPKRTVPEGYGMNGRG